MKSFNVRLTPLSFKVTPFVGVWIEIRLYTLKAAYKHVTPFVGVWIEIVQKAYEENKKKSLPSWECGLKYCSNAGVRISSLVTPFVGVWIEITESMTKRRKA